MATPPPPTVDGALRVSSVIWVAMLITQGLFVGLIFIQGTKVTEPGEPTIPYALFGVGIMLAIASYVVKAKLFAQAAAKREIIGIQTGLVVALAMCEAAGILGLMTFFVFGFKYYLAFFAVSVVAMLGHFPRRSQYEAAAAPKPIL